ncbi:MAG TPA: hypothetical protein VNX68_06760, partial [Nitrosopumilaceae archaeon]|nr:hypothetical protein [Nitrosopumilaceae archaeon]
GRFLKPRKKFNPELEFGHNMGIGTLDHKNSNYNIGIRTLEKGYFESGFRILNLIKSGFSGFGIGAFYRYGPYQQNSPIDNLAVKLCLSLSL